MRQAYMPKAYAIKYREVEKPVPKDNELLIKVSKIGICGSDIHVFEGKHPLVQFPLVQGHEFSGYVAETGAAVSKVRKGDLVVVEPAIGCGVCKKCNSGLIAQCDDLQFIGGALEGGGSEYFLVDEKQVIKYKSGVKPEDAAMTEPLAVAVHNTGRAGDVMGKNIMIMGAGTIGNLTAQVARLKGAKNIVIFDINNARIQIADSCGIKAFDLNTWQSISAVLLEFFGDKKADMAFECVGMEKPLNDCIDNTHRGGTIVVPGVYGHDPKVRMITVQDGELNILGSLMYTWNDFYEAVEYIENEKVKLAPLQTHIVPFDKWIEGYELLEDKSSGAQKVIIDLD